MHDKSFFPNIPIAMKKVGGVFIQLAVVSILKCENVFHKRGEAKCFQKFFDYVNT